MTAMRILSDLPKQAPQRGLCLTIGNFDGLHLGHQALIRRAAEAARERGLDFAAMTFWPHPRALLHPGESRAPLASRAERMRLLEAAGVPLAFELPFTAELAAMSAREFVERRLMPLSLSHLVVGHDFRMGRGRGDGADGLAELGRALGFTLESIPAVEAGGAPISSSRLRAAVAQGDVALARALLGRPHSISGKIVHGDARGRTLGFPTANLGDIEGLPPGHGIYACVAHVKGKRLPAAVSIGVNPTFNGGKTTIEAFLLEGGGDLYGEAMRLDFIARLRDQRKFPSAEELARQIAIDAAQAREILAKEALA